MGNIVKILVENSASIDCLNSFHQTPLAVAAAFNHVDIINFLLQTGRADIEAKDKDGYNPLLLAASEGNAEAVDILLKLHADIFVIDKEDRTVLYWAAMQNHKNVIDVLLKDSRSSQLLQASDRFDNTPLHVAALNNRAEVSAYLKTRYQTTNITNVSGFTPLHYAAENGHTEIVKIIYENQCNPGNLWGNTPLHYASNEGHLEVVSFFLEHLDNIHPTNHLGDTPLHNAARDGHLEVVKCFLLKSKANPSNSYGITPLHKACIKGHFDIAKLIFNAIGRKLPDNFWNNQITVTEEFKRELENKLNSE